MQPLTLYEVITVTSSQLFEPRNRLCNSLVPCIKNYHFNYESINQSIWKLTSLLEELHQNLDQLKH